VSKALANCRALSFSGRKTLSSVAGFRSGKHQIVTNLVNRLDVETFKIFVARESQSKYALCEMKHCH